MFGSAKKFMGLCCVVLLPLVGCAIVNQFIPPFPLDLEGAQAATFQAKAGTPVRNLARFGGVEAPIVIGGGAMTLSLDSISISPDDTSGAKRLLQAQTGGDPNVCLDACAAATVDSDTCSTVCESGRLVVDVWVGPFEAIEAECTSGDNYRFTITLDENGQPTAVSVSPEVLQPSTLDLFNNGGEIGVCIELLSPIDATITLAEVILTFQL